MTTNTNPQDIFKQPAMILGFDCYLTGNSKVVQKFVIQNNLTVVSQKDNTYFVERVFKTPFIRTGVEKMYIALHTVQEDLDAAIKGKKLKIDRVELKVNVKAEDVLPFIKSQKN
jgi:hypothetical protein